MKKLCIFASKILIFQHKCTSWEILSKKVYKFHIFEYILYDRHSVSSQSFWEESIIISVIQKSKLRLGELM